MSSLSNRGDANKCSNDVSYYLTQSKANEAKRIASVKARNAGNARVFRVGNTYLTVGQIAGQVGLPESAISKKVKKLRNEGLRVFELSHFLPTEAANMA